MPISDLILLIPNLEETVLNTCVWTDSVSPDGTADTDTNIGQEVDSLGFDSPAVTDTLTNVGVGSQSLANEAIQQGPVFGAQFIGVTNIGHNATVSAPAGIQAGDLIVALVSDAAGSTDAWTCPGFTQRNITWSLNVNISIHTKLATASEPGSYTFSGASVNSLTILVYRNINDIVPDAIGQSATHTNTDTAPSITPSQANDLILYAMANENVLTDVSALAGWTQRVNGGFASLVCHWAMDDLEYPAGATGTITPAGAGASINSPCCTTAMWTTGDASANAALGVESLSLDADAEILTNVGTGVQSFAEDSYTNIGTGSQTISEAIVETSLNTGTGANNGNYVAEVLSDAPVHYYRLDESLGTNAVDSGSNRDDGAYANGVVLAQPGIIGNAVDFKSTARVVVPSASDLNLNGDHSFELWLKVNSNQSNFPALFIRGTTTTPDWLIYRNVPADGGAALNLKRHTDVGSSAGHVVLGVWAHWVMTYDSTNHIITWYKDGVKTNIQSATLASNSSGSQIFIGWDGTNAVDQYTDEFAIYTTKLSDARVLAHWQATQNIVLPQQAIVETVSNVCLSPQVPVNENPDYVTNIGLSTQTILETISNGFPGDRVSQIAVEVPYSSSGSKARVSQIAVEVPYSATSGQGRVSQIAVEVVRRNNYAETVTNVGTGIQILTFENPDESFQSGTGIQRLSEAIAETNVNIGTNVPYLGFENPTVLINIGTGIQTIAEPIIDVLTNICTGIQILVDEGIIVTGPPRLSQEPLEVLRNTTTVSDYLSQITLEVLVPANRGDPIMEASIRKGTNTNPTPAGLGGGAGVIHMHGRFRKTSPASSSTSGSGGGGTHMTGKFRKGG